jgi:hypothetical protein
VFQYFAAHDPSSSTALPVPPATVDFVRSITDEERKAAHAFFTKNAAFLASSVAAPNLPAEDQPEVLFLIYYLFILLFILFLYVFIYFPVVVATVCVRGEVERGQVVAAQCPAVQAARPHLQHSRTPLLFRGEYAFACVANIIATVGLGFKTCIVQGRTQTINYYQAGSVKLVDLPGTIILFFFFRFACGRSVTNPNFPTDVV